MNEDRIIAIHDRFVMCGLDPGGHTVANQARTGKLRYPSNDNGCGTDADALGNVNLRL
jgi:hypothetical protein